MPSFFLLKFIFRLPHHSNRKHITSRSTIKAHLHISCKTLKSFDLLPFPPNNTTVSTCGESYFLYYMAEVRDFAKKYVKINITLPRISSRIIIKIILFYLSLVSSLLYICIIAISLQLKVQHHYLLYSQTSLTR